MSESTYDLFQKGRARLKQGMNKEQGASELDTLLPPFARAHAKGFEGAGGVPVAGAGGLAGVWVAVGVVVGAVGAGAVPGAAGLCAIGLGEDEAEAFDEESAVLAHRFVEIRAEPVRVPVRRGLEDVVINVRGNPGAR